MCGIAGAVGPGASEDILLGMLSAMRHRGDGPYFAERRVLPDAAIGTNRLGIVDETRGGQPWTTEDGLVSVVLNGEIYNHTELRSQLGHQGPWTGACDTEVLFRAYLEWGEAFVRRLRGMYAIAVLDRRTDTLLLARDPLGIKPLYVGTANGTTLFASELKAFVRVGELTRIEELPPGHLRVNGVQTEFWRLPPFSSQRADVDLEALAGALRDSVLLHFPTDGPPLPCLLSGGVDSSTVTLLSTLLYGGDVAAWTLAAPGTPSADLSAARTVCARIGIPLHTVSPDVAELTDHYLSSGVWMTETWEPALVRNAVSYHFLCRGVREAGHKLCLSGEGADEVFGGYDYFWQLPEPARDAAIHRSLAQIYRTYLQMADRAAMYASVEVRVPYMDAKFVEHCAGLPPSARIRGDTGKWALRQLHPRELPATVRLRAKTGMNAGAGFGSNDPGHGIYHQAVTDRYRRQPSAWTADLEITRELGGAWGVVSDNPEEVFTFARYVEYGFHRLSSSRPRPQVNVSRLMGQPLEMAR